MCHAADAPTISLWPQYGIHFELNSAGTVYPCKRPPSRLLKCVGHNCVTPTVRAVILTQRGTSELHRQIRNCLMRFSQQACIDVPIDYKGGCHASNHIPLDTPVHLPATQLGVETDEIHKGVIVAPI